MTLLATDLLSPLSAGGVVAARAPSPAAGFRRGVGTPNLRPPRGIYIPKGSITNVRFGGHVPTSRGRTGAQKAGLAFETRVHDCLEAIYGIDYRRSPSVLFDDSRGLHRCIPDGLLKIGADLVIIEVKLRHTERAYWQLERLYRPVLSQLVVPGTRTFRVEICRSYDPSEPWPSHAVVTSLHRLPTDRPGVVVWKI